MTTAIGSLGSQLSFSLTGSGAFTTVAQLRTAKPQGSKLSMLDQTNILTPGNGDAPLPGRYSAGEIALDGILSPQNSSQLTLGQLHAAGTLVYWQVLLSDGITVWSFQGYVSEYVPFSLDVNKAIVFSAKIRISGSQTGPAGTA